jgi:hypothetical protein
MYRVLPNKVLFGIIAWLVIGLYVLGSSLQQLLSFQIKAGAVISAAWILLNLLLWNPVWRWLWGRIPYLERAIFPDLNGEWDVVLSTNWPRQEQLIKAAAGLTGPIDVRSCDEDQLAPLTPIQLRAEITQTWWKFEMKLWNPRSDSPIDRSDTISVDPIKGEGLRPHTICYFYKQENQTASITDDAEFYGAARLQYDLGTRSLKGTAWTARKWQRAINTAALLIMSRR